MQCPAQAAFDGIERSQAEGPQRASVGLSWARGKGSRAQALFGHEPSRAWARLVQSLLSCKGGEGFLKIVNFDSYWVE